MESYMEQAIEQFKIQVMEHAKETREAWEQYQINKPINYIADWMNARVFEKAFKIDCLDLYDFIYKQYQF